MKKTIATLLLLFFCALLPVKFLSVSASSLDETTKSLEKSSKCGQIGQACCEEKLSLPEPKLELPDFGPIDDVVNVLLTPFNTLFSATLGPVVHFAENIFSDIIGRQPCAEGRASDPKNINKCICLKKSTFNIGMLCTGLENGQEKSECARCSKHGVWTSIGCVDFELTAFIRDKIFGLGIGLAGGVAFLCILYAAFILQTSQGNAERLKKGREYLTNCILGLVIIIFSVFILRIVGVNILSLPGFGG